MRHLRFSLCLLLFCSCGHAEASPVDNGVTYRLFAGGDILLARRLPAQVHDKGPAWPLSPLTDLIRGADIALANLEGVVSTRGAFWDKEETNPFYFRAPPFMLEVLTEAGFDVVMTANNHAMDFGPEALLEQLELLEAVNIVAVGAGRDAEEAAAPKYVKVGDMVLAVIGLTTYNSPIAAGADRAGVHWINGHAQILNKLAASVAEARRHADLVVFSPHWGGNWTERPTPQRIELAHALIDLGVDAILGHSAHQIHGIEIYKNRPIVYDMGNFLWDSPGPRRSQWSAGFLLEFDRSGFTRLTVHPLQLLPGRTVPADGAAYEQVKDLMMRLTAELDPDAVFQQSGHSLAIDIRPEPRGPMEKTPPAVAHEAGRSATLPDEVRARRGNVVFDAAPAWVVARAPVRLAQDIEFLGAKVPQVVRIGSGFTAEVALRIGGPLEPGWQGMIKGVRRNGKDGFSWPHPIADGNWLPERWQKGETGLDLTLVRPPELKGGTYDLYWRLEHPATDTVAGPIDAMAGMSDGFVPIGEIWVGSLGVPRDPSGVSWDGQLDAAQRLLKRFDITKELIKGSAWAGGAALVLAPLALFLRRRGRAARPG